MSSWNHMEFEVSCRSISWSTETSRVTGLLIPVLYQWPSLSRLYLFFKYRNWPMTKKIMLIIRNKNTLETCKNSRPTSGQSELPKSCTTSTMNFHMVYFSCIPHNNSRLKLSCKFGESKCNPYWDTTLMTSHGINHVLNEHIDFSQHAHTQYYLR